MSDKYLLSIAKNSNLKHRKVMKFLVSSYTFFPY